jgi:hypothetical protein
VDVLSLTAGRFDEQLFREIENATFFIIILSPNSLARCVQESDWVLQELKQAQLRGKAIIPVFKGFRWDQKEGIPNLPEIGILRKCHGVDYSNKEFDAFISQLSRLLISSRQTS